MDIFVYPTQRQMIVLESLPPMNVDCPTADAERSLAREVYEYAVLHANNSGNKDEFQRYISCLRPYYASSVVSDNKPLICGLKLLYLLVENRLSDFHCEVRD